MSSTQGVGFAGNGRGRRPAGAALWRADECTRRHAARPFIVGDLPEILESEPNSAPERAEQVTLPVTINGQIAGERDTDYFQFSLEKGETLTAEVTAARLGSPLETVIELRDAAGRSVAAEELRAGNDPVLVFRAPARGDYQIFVANLGFRGGAQFVYRLTLTKLPYARFAFPHVATVGQPFEIATYRAHGSGELTGVAESWPAAAREGIQGWIAPAAAANRLPIVGADVPVLVEREPNDSAVQATVLAGRQMACGQFRACCGRRLVPMDGCQG